MASFQHTLTGENGSTWNLAEGPVFLMPGVIGLEEPEAAVFVDEYATMDGGAYRGWRAKPRNVILPVQINGKTPAEFLATRKAWNKTIGTPGNEVKWKVSAPGQPARTLTMRSVPMGSFSRDIDSGLSLSETYPLVFTAVDPFWKGAAINRTWDGDTGEWPDVFAGPGVLNIAPSSTYDAVTITNDGDVPAYAVWKLEGPFLSGAHVGIDGHVITIPFSMSSGQFIVIDTRPTHLKAYDHTGARRTADLGSRDFATIPPGADVVLDISFTGAGSISVQITPSYLKAY